MRNKTIEITILQHMTSHFFVGGSILCVGIIFLLASSIFCISYNIVSAIHDNVRIESFLLSSDYKSQKTILTYTDLSGSIGTYDTEETACEYEEELEIKCELASKITVGDLCVCHVFLSNHFKDAATYCKNKFIALRKSVIIQV